MTERTYGPGCQLAGITDEDVHAQTGLLAKWHIEKVLESCHGGVEIGSHAIFEVEELQ